LGNVLSFQKSEETTKKARTFLKDYINLKVNKNVSMLLDPLFIIQKNYSTMAIASSHLYFNQNKYVCHVVNDSVDFKDTQTKDMLKTLT
jgi:hypothetical protein